MNGKLGIIGSVIKMIVSLFNDNTFNDLFCITIILVAYFTYKSMHNQVKVNMADLKKLGNNKVKQNNENNTSSEKKSNKKAADSLVQKQWAKYQNDIIRSGYSKSNIKKYFNKAIIIDIPGKRKIADIIPGILTALGILGTFLGLFNGIGELFGGVDSFNTADLSKNIGGLLSGMSLAFVTSIVGIFCSIIWSTFDRIRYKNYIYELNQFIQKSIEEDKSVDTRDLLEKLIEVQEEQKSAIESIGTSVAIEVGKVLDDSINQNLLPGLNQSISQSIIPAIEDMSSSFADFSTVASNSQTEGIGKVVDKFLETMNSALQGQFENLADTIEDLCKWQIETKESLDSLIGELQEATKNQKEINISSEEMINGFSDYFNELKSASTDLNQNIKEMSGVVITFDEMIQYSKELASEMEEKEKNLEGRTQDYLININDSISSMKEHWSTTQSNLIDVNNALENSTKEFSNNLKDGLDRTFEVFDDNLASISNRLSGTIGEVQQTIEELPNVVQGLSNSLNSTLDKVPSVIEEVLIKNTTA